MKLHERETRGALGGAGPGKNRRVSTPFNNSATSARAIPISAATRPAIDSLTAAYFTMFGNCTAASNQLASSWHTKTAGVSGKRANTGEHIAG